MLHAGNAIDATLGVTFGLSTLAAAACGQHLGCVGGLRRFKGFKGFKEDGYVWVGGVGVGGCGPANIVVLTWEYFRRGVFFSLGEGGRLYIEKDISR